MRLIFAFGVAFELPVLIVLLATVGIVSVEGLRSKRRYMIVAAFVVAAVLTPPDVISQVLMAVPIIVLYELAILCSVTIARKRARDAAEAEGPAGKEDREAAAGPWTVDGRHLLTACTSRGIRRPALHGIPH